MLGFGAPASFVLIYSECDGPGKREEGRVCCGRVVVNFYGVYGHQEMGSTREWASDGQSRLWSCGGGSQLERVETSAVLFSWWVVATFLSVLV